MTGYIDVTYGGDLGDLQSMLDSFPGKHDADEVGHRRYCIATGDVGFIEFVWRNQGYGEVLEVRRFDA